MTGKDKNEARRLLEKRDFDGLFLWMQSVRSPLRIVFSLTFDTDELIVWRAIEATGKIAAATAASDVEKVRDFIRRLLWLMNDESGALGWHAPEVIGEILVNVPSLIEEIGVLLPSFFREEPFERGAHYAVYRITRFNPAPFLKRIQEIEQSLASSDPVIRLYIALILKTLGRPSYRDALISLRKDGTEISIYDFETGELHTTTVGALATKSLAPS